MYFERELERKFLKMSAAFKVVLLTGARQTGKTTMLKHLSQKENRTFVSMDDSKIRDFSRENPDLFFQVYKPPVLIDEIQKAPWLCEQIKLICDNTDKKGLFWLTGSQSKKLLKTANESLAGRVCILKMYSLSYKEKMEIKTDKLDFSFSALTERKKYFPENNIIDVYRYIYTGGYPEIQNFDNEEIYEYWNSYIENYLMRDAVDDNGISDTEGFRRCLRACAAFTGNLINYTDIANASGVSVVTAKQWVKILESMGIIFLLEPYYSNELKRMVKTPKLYFCDTGLCAFLSSWTNTDTLLSGAASGRFFENYVVGELLRSFAYGKGKVIFNYYRDTNQKEIDIVIEKDGKIYPFEVKMSSNPDKKIIKTFSLLEKTNKEISNGGIVCMVDMVLPIDSKNHLIPANII